MIYYFFSCVEAEGERKRRGGKWGRDGKMSKMERELKKGGKRKGESGAERGGKRWKAGEREMERWKDGKMEREVKRDGKQGRKVDKDGKRQRSGRKGREREMNKGIERRRAAIYSDATSLELLIESGYISRFL